MVFRSFRAGTRILSQRGEVPVEELRVGERIVGLAGGGLVGVRWIGTPMGPGEEEPGPALRIAAGAFDDGRPRQDLWVHADTAMLIDGRLVAAGALANGATIAYQPEDDERWWQVDCTGPELLLAEGVPVENLHDAAEPAAFPRWEAGPELAELQGRLLQRAIEVFGHRIVDDPALRVMADGAELAATVGPDELRVVVPPERRELFLMSRVWVPAEVIPGAGDRRELGVCVRSITVDGRALPLDDPALDEGWHPPEEDAVGPFRWTAGAASLPARPGEIVVALFGDRRYWAGREPPPYPGRWPPRAAAQLLTLADRRS